MLLFLPVIASGEKKKGQTVYEIEGRSKCGPIWHFNTSIEALEGAKIWPHCTVPALFRLFASSSSFLLLQLEQKGRGRGREAFEAR